MQNSALQMIESRLRGQIDVDEASRSLFAGYIAYQVPNYLFSPHNEKIIEKLQAVEAGVIRRLIITMPPRHGKTMLTSELFPSWYLGRNPKDEVIAATYSYERGADVGRKVRNYMASPVYNYLFPNSGLAPDVKGANKLATRQGGIYYSVGAGGAIVGRGANLFLIDDPLKSREEAESERIREGLKDWYRSVVYTRLMPNNRIVIIMTRWHYDDPIGWLLSRDDASDWHVLSLPAIATHHDEIKRSPGQALWPAFYPEPVLKKTRSVVGTREWNAQYQQVPVSVEDAIFRLDWFKRYDPKIFLPWLWAIRFRTDLPANEFPLKIKRIVMSWDTAYKEEEIHDPSSLTIWGQAPNMHYLLYRFNKRMQYPELMRKIRDFWNRYTRVFAKLKFGPIVVLIEDKASGQSIIQELKENTLIPVIARPAEIKKTTRAHTCSGVVEAGLVALPEEADWLIPYESQMIQFPFAREDDDVDSTTQYLNWQGKPRFKRGKLRLWK